MTEPGSADLTETAPALENDRKTSLLMVIAISPGRGEAVAAGAALRHTPGLN